MLAFRKSLWGFPGTFSRSISSFSPPNLVRQYSALPGLSWPGYRGLRTPPPLLARLLQSRTLFGSVSSQNQLANMEQTANNNIQSASTQNAFYQTLLRANMPEIVVERYQSGRYATNAACEASYMKALERVGQAEKAKSLLESPRVEGKSSSLSQDQIQAIGQALAAQAGGGNISIAAKTNTTSTGAKDAPLYVVVEETIGSTIFKWAKLFLYVGLAGYIFLVTITVTIEATGVLKKVGGVGDIGNIEAQAQHQTVRFSDVHGCEEAKDELQELVDFLRNPEKFSSLGGKLPKGVLLVGPPGTGKTLLARAVAGEAGVPFFFMSGSEFDEVYVGVGAKRVRELFNAARAKAPAIVFIDELDAIGGKRNERDAAYVKQTLNQLLTDLDGFAQNSGVIFLAATNFPGLLDKALTRPGRFDRKIVVPIPDVRGRIAILTHHMKKIKTGLDVDATVIARGTPGFSGAELENIVNQAAIHASRAKAKTVSMDDFEWAKDKILMGAERRSAVIQPKDKQLTAYHEGGHALVALYTPGSAPLYKATIMPRGEALGLTQTLPEMDQVSMAKREFLARIDVCMGGKVAEELVYGPDYVTSGASSDIQTATSIAYSMVTQMGMSDSLGNVDLASTPSRLSPATKEHIEREVRRLLEEARQRASALLTSKRKELDLLAAALIEYESLNKEEMEKVVRGEKLVGKISVPKGTPIKVPEMSITAGRGGRRKALGGLGGVVDVEVETPPPPVPPVTGVEGKPARIEKFVFGQGALGNELE
ncbi:MAG: ATP-dependent zinc metalloprotease FTSH 4, mitochondrial [Trizodia sp. TS-e1964]|nr:MAG: ATP-dependent zinc metalloprotease FTSH 4, mitochondrial [Trizodia sp. TS-e1964]